MDFEFNWQRMGWWISERDHGGLEEAGLLLFFHYVDGGLCGCITQRTHQHQDAGRATGACVMLWAMFCWESLSPALHVGSSLTGTTYPSFVADHHYAPNQKKKSFKSTTSLGSCPGLQSFPDLNPTQHLWEELRTHVMPWRPYVRTFRT